MSNHETDLANIDEMNTVTAMFINSFLSQESVILNAGGVLKYQVPLLLRFDYHFAPQ